jgi:ankyrin repeat protein
MESSYIPQLIERTSTAHRAFLDDGDPLKTDQGLVPKLRPWIALGALLAVLATAQAGEPTEPGSIGFRMSRKAETAAALATRKTQPDTLERAVWTQDRQSTRGLLRAGADPNALSSGNKESLIVVAAMQGDPEIIEELIAHGANVNAASRTGSPLYWAARQGNLEAVRRLLARGANVNYNALDGGTALHSALGDGNDVRIAELLLDKGADLEAANSGLTPLMMAALFHRVDWVRLFIRRGAQVNARTPSGQTPLALSRTFGREAEIERLLKDAGAH